MRLPGWFVRAAKPIYKRVQGVPVVGPLARKTAHFVLSRKGGGWPRFRSRRRRELEELAERMRQYALIMQGLDQANRRLFEGLGELENRLSRGERELRGRVEFVRDEVMFELRRALQLDSPAVQGGATGRREVEAKLITPGALSRRPLRLNLGCGHLPHEGYVNVDGRELPGVDLVADVAALPLAAGEVDEIFASHLVEHFSRRYLQDLLLPYWYSLLSPGGVLRLILPDAQGMLKAYAEGEMSFDDLVLVTFGKQDYDGDFHYSMYTPEAMKEVLQAVRFDSIEVVATNRSNGLCREMELRAVRGEAA
jgi:predicted SAM-dependent methyltransferase